MVPRRSLIALAAATAAALAAAPPALATVRHVHPGQSIQRAIDRSHPGDVVKVAAGVYHENLTVAVDDLTLRGAGAGRHGTVLVPRSAPRASICTQLAGSVIGICAHGNPQGPGDLTGFTLRGFRVVGFPNDGVTIFKGDHTRITRTASGNNGANGFTVFASNRTTLSRTRSWHNGFTGEGGFGVFMFQSNRTTVSWSHAWDNNGYGISGFVLHKVRYLHDVVNDNTDIGFYVGDSPEADAVVRWNTAYRNNEFGFFFRDSSHGVARDNLAWGNCTGFAAIDIGENPAPTVDWTLRRNRAVRNNDACPASEDGPALSGIGIWLLGTQDSVVARNVVRGNHPTGESPFAGGISLLDGTPLGGAAPTGNRISRNVARHNRPFDIRYDRSGSGNRFRRNVCGRSTPPFICN